MDYLDRLDYLKGLKDDCSPQFVSFINELEKLHNSRLMEQGNLFMDYFSSMLCSVVTVHLTSIHCTHLFSSHTPGLSGFISGDAAWQDDMCCHDHKLHAACCFFCFSNQWKTLKTPNFTLKFIYEPSFFGEIRVLGSHNKENARQRHE